MLPVASSFVVKVMSADVFLSPFTGTTIADMIGEMVSVTPSPSGMSDIISVSFEMSPSVSIATSL